jgi:hypothetical protein
MQDIVIMARGIGDTGQAAVLDGGKIKRLLKIAGTTNHADRDVTVVVLSYGLFLIRAHAILPQVSRRVGHKIPAQGSARSDAGTYP